MKFRTTSGTKQRVFLRGMTLIELLVVMAIMLTLLALVGYSFQSFGRTTEITNGIQDVANVLNVARQIAVSRNEYAQVRIYGAPATDFRAGQFTALAVFRADAPYYTNDYTALLSAGRMRQEGQIARLPQSCIITSNAPYSPLIQTLISDSMRQILLADGTKGVAFYFKPDGSLDIPATNGTGPTVNALSICAMQAFAAAGKTLPPNYGIINMDRINGRFQVVRP
jgi:uncharacterized protein (TIGR02596 family)